MKLDLSSVPGVYKTEEHFRKKYYCSAEEFEHICFYLKSNAGYIWFVDVIGIDQKAESNNIELRYLFNLVETGEQIFLIVELAKNVEMKSIAHLWGSASIGEHELSELFGIKFNRSYSANLFSDDNKVHPLLKNELRTPQIREFDDEEVISLENPLLSSQVSFSIEEKLNLISKCNVITGTYHIGLEKIFENLPLKKAYIFLENYFACGGSNWAFLLSHSAELQNNIDVPDRAKALRMVILELNRILEHFYSFRDLCLYFKSNRYFKQSLIWINRVQSLMVSSSGNEYMANMIRLGGINGDVNQAWLSRVINELGELEVEVRKAYTFIIGSVEWHENLNINLLSKTVATNHSLTGPIARASGLNIDERKINPFYFYKDVEFEIPVGTSGSILDLFSIKMEEIFQSVSIVTQVLDNLPTGRCLNKNYVEFEPMKKLKEIDDEQAYRDEVKHLYHVDDFDGTQFIEGSNGLMGLTTLFKNQKIERIKFFSNEFYLKNLFEQTMKLRDRNMIELIWTSIGIDMKTVER